MNKLKSEFGKDLMNLSRANKHREDEIKESNARSRAQDFEMLKKEHEEENKESQSKFDS